MTCHPETAILENLMPAELLQAMQDHKVLLIDVREPDEFAAERIPGAFLYPLSSFDPGWIPAATALPMRRRSTSAPARTRLRTWPADPGLRY